MASGISASLVNKGKAAPDGLLHRMVRGDIGIDGRAQVPGLGEKPSVLPGTINV